MLLREAYEISHRLLESKQQEHPFGLVLTNKKENVLEYGPLYRLFGDYKDKGVKDKFGLSIAEFLELPRHIVNFILELCAREVRVDAKTLSDIEKELNGK